ncbi:hypothetical protein, partial [Psychrobacter celer]|uniref:hypothetical protein n=2 Tax=Psychrobacter celer TaxID=306572 RepID=UPI003F95D177
LVLDLAFLRWYLLSTVLFYYATTVARRTLVNLPDNWEVDYFERGHHRIARSSDIWYHLVHLCEDPIVWMDDATYHGED